MSEISAVIVNEGFTHSWVFHAM